MLKYKMNILFIFILTLCTFTFVNAEEQQLKGKIIYLDAGHGGRDPGAIYKDLKESKINLEISNELKLELESHGAKVYQTRIGDYDLSKINTRNHKRSDLETRAKIINESDCDIYISIHLNSDPSPTWNGTQIFYTNKNEKNKELAQIIQNEFKEKLKSKREIKPLKNMYLFDRIKKPGVLIEAGFISNANDRYLLKNKEHQKKIADTITDALIKYYK
ncbi:MAG: N-acetylmuramoyl-L-alanine amidase [Bacilli bacterium]